MISYRDAGKEARGFMIRIGAVVPGIAFVRLRVNGAGSTVDHP